MKCKYRCQAIADTGVDVCAYNCWYLDAFSPSFAFPVKTPFVDASAITVDDAACIGYGSYGKVHRGEYQGTPVAVKIIPDNPWTAHEFTIPG